MKIKVLFFGKLGEIMGKREMNLDRFATTKDLKDFLLDEFPSLNYHKFIVAVNQEVTRKEAELREGDEVAFLPPYAGG